MDIKLLKRIVFNNFELELAEMISSFFSIPNKSKIEEIVFNPTLRKYKNEITGLLGDIYILYCEDRKEYSRVYLNGQKIVWDTLLECIKKIKINSEVLSKKDIIFFPDSYNKSCNEVNKICEIYSNSQLEISKYEDILGVDRYLDKVAIDDLALISSVIESQLSIINAKLNLYKDLFQNQWGLFNVKDILVHKLVKYDKNNEVCSLLSAKNNRVILFVIDGFGYLQYQWNKRLNKENHFLTYKENIFNWLSNAESLKEYILGSAFISDTAAGISQIFGGRKNKETGIISSKIMYEGKILNTKQLDKISFKNIFETDGNNVMQILSALNCKSKIYFCSKHNEEYLGFSDYCYRAADFESVVPQERVFSTLKDNFEKDIRLHIVYMTSIDNSGHTMGAYSKFEKYEHEKINSLFRNFLIEIAMSNPEYFDGKTSILLTADHGMAESSNKMINWKDLDIYLKDNNYGKVKFVENNRALFCYCNDKKFIASCAERINKYFQEMKMNVEICLKYDKTYMNFMCDQRHKSSILMPDIIIKLIDNGLFYSRELENKNTAHYAGHGGGSVNEVFVPLLEINLDEKLLKHINNRFIGKL